MTTTTTTTITITTPSTTVISTYLRTTTTTTTTHTTTYNYFYHHLRRYSYYNIGRSTSAFIAFRKTDSIAYKCETLYTYIDSWMHNIDLKPSGYWRLFKPVKFVLSYHWKPQRLKRILVCQGETVCVNNIPCRTIQPWTDSVQNDEIVR